MCAPACPSRGACVVFLCYCAVFDMQLYRLVHHGLVCMCVFACVCVCGCVGVWSAFVNAVAYEWFCGCHNSYDLRINLMHLL